MRVLGAILCGGLSSRFGSDKAAALVGGVSLFERVRMALAPQVDGVVCCGRSMGGLEALADRPAPGLGPLGGLAAGLHAARERGFDAVLSVPVDVPSLPADVRRRLETSGTAYIDGLPVLGFWPACLSPALDAFIAAGGKLSVRRWAAEAGAAAVSAGAPIANLNTPGELHAWERGERPSVWPDPKVSPR